MNDTQRTEASGVRKPAILAVASTLLRVFPGRLGDRAGTRRFKVASFGNSDSAVCWNRAVSFKNIMF